jgi:SPP1 gp7 family putative phage head morphogenesis protein
LDLLHALNKLVSRIVSAAREFVAPAAAEQSRRFQRDDVGANARSIIELLRKDAERAEAQAQVTASEAISSEGTRHTRKWTAGVGSSAQIDLGLLLRDDDLVDLLSVRSEEFNRLIRNLSNDVLDRIERQTLGAIFEGRGQEDIAKSLQDVAGIGRRRARLIAQDQAAKLNGAMNQFRQEQAGITHYKWRTIMDGRERPEHHARDKKVFSWTKPPSDGHPGHAINCRCRALAVITDDPEDLVTNPGEPLGDFFEENLPAIREVAQTPKQPVFEFSPQQIAERLAQTRELSSRVGVLGSGFTEAQAERLVIELYGFKPSDDDLRNLLYGLKKLTASRRTVLIEAAKARLAMIEGQLSHARLSPGNFLAEGSAQETLAAKTMAPDGFAAVPVSETAAQIGRIEGLSPLARKHFETYSEYGYRIINKYARDGVVTEIRAGKLVPASQPDVAAAMIEKIGDTIQSSAYSNILPSEAVLFRGTGTKTWGDAILTPGFTWREPAFTSTTRALKTAGEFYAAADRPVIMVIYAGGKRGIPIERISQFAYEQEVILPAGTTFRVRSVERAVKRSMMDRGRTFVHVDIVGQEQSVAWRQLRQQPNAKGGQAAPFFRVGNVSAKPIDVAAAEAREDVLRIGRATNSEVVSAYDATGRNIGVWSSGSADRVSLAPASELRSSKHSITVHHNHPNDMSFSVADYAAFDTNPGMARLYAHGHDGSDYILERVSSRPIGAMADRVSVAVRNEAIDAILAGEIDDETMDRLFHHVVGKVMDRLGVVNYRAKLGARAAAAEGGRSGLVNGMVERIYSKLK